MNVTDYDNMTNDFSDSLSINDNCSISENIIDEIIPTVLLTIPWGLSFLCSLSLMIYTLIKPLKNSNKNYLQL